MKQRIVNKKLKRDVELKLWVNQWVNSVQTMSATVNHVFEDDLTKIRFSLASSLAHYEISQLYKIAVRKYNIKYRQVWNWYRLC